MRSRYLSAALPILGLEVGARGHGELIRSGRRMGRSRMPRACVRLRCTAELPGSSRAEGAPIGRRQIRTLQTDHVPPGPRLFWHHGTPANLSRRECTSGTIAGGTGTEHGPNWLDLPCPHVEPAAGEIGARSPLTIHAALARCANVIRRVPWVGVRRQVRVGRVEARARADTARLRRESRSRSLRRSTLAHRRAGWPCGRAAVWASSNRSG